MSDLDEAGRPEPGADGGAERRPPRAGTLRLDLRERLTRIEAELRELGRLIEELPTTIRRAMWRKIE